MKACIRALAKTQMGNVHMPVSIILSSSLTRNIPAIENDNGRHHMVVKQIDSVHRVFYVPHFLIVV